MTIEVGLLVVNLRQLVVKNLSALAWRERAVLRFASAVGERRSRCLSLHAHVLHRTLSLMEDKIEHHLRRGGEGHIGRWSLRAWSTSRAQ
jgi:hypothetical protein